MTDEHGDLVGAVSAERLLAVLGEPARQETAGVPAPGGDGTAVPLGKTTAADEPAGHEPEDKVIAGA